jgi:hypothetical protein
MLKNFFLLLAVAVCFAACTKSNNSNKKPLLIPADTATSTVQLNSFPLQVGYKWTYQLQTQTQSPGNPSTYTPVTSKTFTITIVSDTTINGIHLFKFTNSLDPSFGDYYSFQLGYYNSIYNYYTADSTGIYMLDAISHASQAYVDDTAYLLAKYPVNIGDSWSSQNNYAFYNCKWDSSMQVTVPAGSFDCARLIGTSGTYSTKQYYSTKGLVMNYENINKSSTGTAGTEYYIRLTTLVSVNF